MIKVEPLAFETNYDYLVRDLATGTLGVVDLADGAELTQRFKAQGQTPDFLFLTHHHHDHVEGLEDFLAAFPQVQVVKPLGETRISVPALEMGPTDSLLFGRTSVQALLTHAHTKHCAAYLFDQTHLFVGDALFRAGCGRLFEGDGPSLEAAMDRFGSLPPQTLLYFGHEYGLANLKFAATLEPLNQAIGLAQWELQACLEQGIPGAPVSLGQELRVNPFLRLDLPGLQQHLNPLGTIPRSEQFLLLRRQRDKF
ncbi:MAG: hypothetical protein A2600_06485 [Candidatus Lambdaproteobacteria bacterium RIFOXYD1_FULL_56_27]|uniref:Hydroxyacylglutathione hydrolase n=1 Tax=Candidatus Lambdaproteobacteria bacterium RIFOXYD2_FULL_56_26 TaxID=1817773 RepID=A0A1F6H0M7_9PROT|nr:MAG: hypothetical protein A2426_05900 [Candidatus Lambdaproteobacteria bacterium RIFOXYC1_FULL_56_13]OGH03854.1 MAG: hypothetical protein A2557_11995 [Candidatus Lambdaproteobacteria bacterium RIFOXYD2_FULL_56_26]OGH08982.1 MAG: hypothetical protein A2600_06485 [Candidatus Lambdaproteobacteria bacterium RIFOXYD1_FULL_56_27]